MKELFIFTQANSMAVVVAENEEQAREIMAKKYSYLSYNPNKPLQKHEIKAGWSLLG